MNTAIMATAASALLLLSLGAIRGDGHGETIPELALRPSASATPLFHVRRLPVANPSRCDEAAAGTRAHRACAPLHTSCGGAPRTDGSVLITWTWNVLSVICVELGGEPMR